ncbi:MAG: hypothetical protein NT051_04270, partial [Candidatus Micrarchaeota archaeon]|nr:hypothetical protein [Candidatus Micrarchaeota archaeon]
MALDDFLISTGVDQLIRLVKERGKIEIGTAASELKIPNKTVEDWAHVLEEEKLVSIEYKLTKIYLVWHEPTKQYVAQKSEKLQAKASTTGAEIDRLLSKVQDEGKALAAMQQEVSAMGGAQLTSADTKKLKAEILELQEEMAQTSQAASEKLENLQKRALAASEGIDSKTSGKKVAAFNELKNEFAVLKRFEDTLTSQSNEADANFGEFEKKIEEMRAQVERGNAAQVLTDVKEELESVKSLKDEILGAIEAVTEEVQAMDQKISDLSGRVDTVSDSGGSLAAAKKKLANFRKMADEAKKQKAATKERLEDSISLIKKQSARIEDVLSRAGTGMGSPESMKNEYVDIAEEMSRANEELASRQKEISAKLSSQL